VLRVFRRAFRGRPDARTAGRVDSAHMSEEVTARVAWRRRHTPSHYVGTLAATDVALRLDGREPATGIELSLSIPFEEIEAVRASSGAGDLLVGEPAVVLQLAGSEPVLLREVGPDSRLAADLAKKLIRLRDRTRGSQRTRRAGRRRAPAEGRA
jgi:hypothetical protein